MTDLHSCHTFLYPFRWDLKTKSECDNSFFAERFSDRVDIEKLSKILSNNGWSYNSFEIKTPKDYNEYVYFYEYAQDVIYNKYDFNEAVKRQASSYFFKYKCQSGKYIIKTGNKEFSLDIKHISLRVYATGVAILVFHAENRQHGNFDEILKINDFGRRIYPQFLDENFSTKRAKEAFLASEISIELADGNKYHDNFRYFDKSSNVKKNPNKLPDFIQKFIADDNATSDFEEFKTEKTKELLTRHIIDDRMFTICTVINSAFIYKLQQYDESKCEYAYAQDKDWYRLIFVDNNNISCSSKLMLKELNVGSTYDRWIEDGILYGATRYSFIGLFSDTDFARNVLLSHMKTIYTQMFLLLIAQRASILRFSDEVNEISGIKEGVPLEEVKELYNNYIHFINKLFFREVTAQDQGIELYSKAMEIMNIEKHAKDLDAEIAELYQYMQLTEDAKANKNMENLTKFGTTFMPAALVASIFGMNTFGSFDYSILIEVLIIALAGLAVFIGLKNTKKGGK